MSTMREIAKSSIIIILRCLQVLTGLWPKSVTKPKKFIQTVTRPTLIYVITNSHMTKDEVYIRDIMDRRSAEAYRALVEIYQNKVFTLCLKIVKNREEAEEVAQDVFITCFSKLNELQDKKKFPNWLMKIAYSKAIDHVRKKRMVKSDIDAVAESYFKTEQTPLKSTIKTGVNF